MSENKSNKLVIANPANPEPTTDCFINRESQTKINDQNLVIEEKNQELTSYYTSTIFGKIFFNWTRYAMKLANKASLKISDFNKIGENDFSENLLEPVSDKWYQEKSKLDSENPKKNAFFKSILKVYYKKIIILSILNLITSGLKYLQIYFYDAIIQNFEHHHEPEENESPLFPVYGNAIGLVITKAFTTFFHHQVKFNSEISGVKAANAAAALIYEKVMKSSVFLKNQISEGEISFFILEISSIISLSILTRPAVSTNTTS